MLTEDKITEISAMVDEFCEVYNGVSEPMINLD